MTLQNGRPEKMRQLASSKLREIIFKADVILGVAEETGHEFLVFGRGILKESIELNTTIKAMAIKVPILQSTNELEMLLAAVQVAKGRHEYESGTA